MTEKFYIKSGYGTDHATYGGRIYNFDYDEGLTMPDVASRIISDWNFDQKCRKLAQNRYEKNNRQTNEHIAEKEGDIQ